MNAAALFSVVNQSWRIGSKSRKKSKKNGNVLTLTMERLREANGAGKLGVNVCVGIEKTLAGMGLGHIPQKLPTSQNHQVRLYKRGTEVGELIQLVLTPGERKDIELVERFSGQVPHYAVIGRGFENWWRIDDAWFVASGLSRSDQVPAGQHYV